MAICNYCKETELVMLVTSVPPYSPNLFLYNAICPEINSSLGFYSLVLCSQAGEGASEEGCGADEDSGPQLQTWSCGPTGKCNMGFIMG